MSRHADGLSIHLLPGNVAPRYLSEVKELRCERAVITEKGMSSGFPLVDLQLVDEQQGNQYFFALTGSICIALAQAIKGVNLRNHGVEER